MTRAQRQGAAARAAKHVARQVATSVAKRQTSAFARWALRGGLANFVIVGFNNGYKKLTFPLSVLVPAVGSPLAEQAVAWALWFAGATVLGYWWQKRQRRGTSAPVVASVPLIVGVMSEILRWPAIAWAHDGGFIELVQDGSIGGIPVLAAQSAAVGFVCGLGGRIGEGLAGRSGSAVDSAPPPDVSVEILPPLIDPDSDGEPLVVNDGRWPDVPVGHVWYGEWLTREQAAEQVRRRQEELRRRQGEIDAFLDETERQSAVRVKERAERLQREGFVYDPESDAWKPGPDHPERRHREALEKIQRTIAAMDRLATQLPAADMIRIEQSQETILDSQAPDEERAQRLERLTRAVFDKTQGRAMAQAAAAEHAAERAAIREGVTRAGIQMVGMAAGGMYMAGLKGGGLVMMGANALHGGYQGYQEGGARKAALEAVRSALPINTGVTLYEGGSAGQMAIAILQDLGNAVGLRDGANALRNIRASTAAGNPLLGAIFDKADDAAAAGKAVSNQIDDAWRAERARGQRLIDEFDELRRRAAAAATPAEQQALGAQLRRKAAEINASYSAKSILKPQQGSLSRALDEEVAGIYRDVDRRTMQELNDMGFRKGGRPFHSQDMVDLRNAASKGTVGMDRDIALNELNRRRLRELLERQVPGTEKANLIQQKLSALERDARVSIDFDKYTGHVQGRLRTLAQDGPADALQSNRLLREIAESSDRGPEMLKKIDKVRGMHDQLLRTNPNSAAVRQLGQARGMLDDLAQAQQRGRGLFEKMGKVREIEQRLGQIDPRSADGRRLVRELMDARKAATDAGRVSPTTWNEIGQKTYDRIYDTTTGQNAVKSYQAFTQSRNPEAYFDLGVLKNDPVGTPFQGRWAAQTASVTSFKTYHNNHLAHLGHLNQGEAIQETARGLAKDMKTKLLPLLQNDMRTSDDAFQRLGRLQQVLNQVGEGTIPPGQLDRVLKSLYPEVPDMGIEKTIQMVTTNLEAGIQGHRPGLPSWTKVLKESAS